EAEQVSKQIRSKIYVNKNYYTKERSDISEISELILPEEALQSILQTNEWVQKSKTSSEKCEKETRPLIQKPISEIQEISKKKFNGQRKSISVPPSSQNITINILQYD
ncbi:10036_t:CDS:1, partial [Ambispora leptoticha]